MSDKSNETGGADAGDATTDADPELLADLKRRADAHQASLANESGDADATDEADQDVLADLRQQAQRSQEQRSAETSVSESAEDTDEADQDVLADLRQQAQRSQEQRSQEQRSAESVAPEPEPEPAASTAAPRPPTPETQIPVPELVDDVESTATTTMSQSGGRSNSASAFVRQARDSSDTKVDTAPAKKRKSNGLVVLVAIVLGAQILAAGAFFTLRSLQSDDDQTEEVAEEGGELDAIVPTPIPGGATAVPLNATPTPVPPTPVWRPITEGPRTNPFSFSVEAIVNEPLFFDGPDGSAVTPDTPITLTSPRASGEPLVLLVGQGEPGDDWAQVMIPGSDEDVWVNAAEFTWRSSNTVIQIDMASNRVRIFEGNDLLHFDFVATGRLDNPTQQVVTWTIEDPPDGSAGRDAGDPVALLAAVDGRGQSLTIGLADGFIEGDGYITDGTVLVLSETADVISEHVRAGSRVEFVGTPPRPTPTPVPTPTVDPQAIVGAPGGGGGSPGCSGGQGTPPNCYRIVDRQTVKGQCESYQVELTGSCTLFGGDKNLSDPNQPDCPAAAPDLIEDRCYKVVGPVPEIPGDCPPDATDVDGECRVAL